MFHPLPDEERRTLRATFWEEPWVSPEDFLLVNVNAHQRRKDIPRSLEVLAELRRLGVPAKLLLHMHETSPHDAVSLNTVGRQLGLTPGVEFQTHDAYFRQGFGLFSDVQLNSIYNLADGYLSTSLGEGWGLGNTEALAAGCPVFMPDHTSCGEIGRQLLMHCGMDPRFELLPPGEHVVLSADNSRLRPRVDVRLAAELIASYWRSGEHRRRPALPASVREWLSWDRVARAMWEQLTQRSPESSTCEPLPDGKPVGGLTAVQAGAGE